MDFLDKVIETTKSIANTVGKKAVKVVDISKLKLNQAELNSDLRKSFECIGKTVYNCTKENRDFSDEVNCKLKTIDEIYNKLEVIKNEISKTKEEIKSKNSECNCENTKDSSPYCCQTEETKPDFENEDTKPESNEESTEE